MTFVDALPEDARPIPGCPTYFLALSGDVYRERRWPSGVLRIQRISPWINGNDRVHVSLWVDGRQTIYSVHRLVALTFVGCEPFPGAIVRHLDGDHRNNIPANLAWGTYAENSADKDRHGRTPRGSRSHNAKLTESDIPTIRQRLAAGRSAASLGREYGVAKIQILRIKHGRTWAHVPAAGREAARRMSA